ncbi:hypothetical protein AVEN_10868-1, partial [Araneus ventricosus]
TATEKRHCVINTMFGFLTVKLKRLRPEQNVKAKEDDWMEDEDEADNEENK